MNLKCCKKKKKTLVDPRHKNTNYLFSPEESISYGSTNRGSLENQEEQEITLKHLLNTKNLAKKTFYDTNAMNQVTTKAATQIYRKKSLKITSPKKRRKVLWQRGMTQNLRKL